MSYASAFVTVWNDGCVNLAPFFLEHQMLGPVCARALYVTRADLGHGYSPSDCRPNEPEHELCKRLCHRVERWLLLTQRPFLLECECNHINKRLPWIGLDTRLDTAHI